MPRKGSLKIIYTECLQLFTSREIWAIQAFSREMTIQRTEHIKPLSELKSMAKIKSPGQFSGSLQTSQNKS